MKKIYIASDHAGFALKQSLVQFLRDQGHEVEDLGASVLDLADDYPDFIVPLAHKVAEEEGNAGIIIGGSGQGEAMSANRVHGARAIVFYGGSDDIIKLSREHNDANILSLGARFLTEKEAQHAVTLWLTTDFSGDGRHVRRLAKF